MKIRTITLGINWREEDRSALEHEIKSFFTKAIDLFAKQGFDSRTHRITLPVFVIGNSEDNQVVRSSVERVSALCKDTGIRWFCVPFYIVGQDTEETNVIAVDIAKQYKNAFINYIVTEDRRLDRRAVFHASSFVRAVSRISNNGFDNFRCGVSFNCKPNGAFFPFTYHAGENGFSLAMELVPLCVEVIQSNKGKSLEEIRSSIIDKLLPVLKLVGETGLKIEETTGMTYFGIDASLAPHPENPEHSVAYIVELLGVERFGSSGTTFITSFLADIIKSLIKRSGIRATGFNGVMYSVLEDHRLGVVNSESGNPSIDSLLAFSTMCGCGIDMVPVPGAISTEELASIMLDIAAIAIRLNKPLGVRLLPIPEKTAGEFTDFDHDFLHNTRIQQVKYSACSGSFFDAKQPFTYLSQ